jgi:hypothetical protein
MKTRWLFRESIPSYRLIAIFLIAMTPLLGKAPNSPRDVLLFTDGEKLLGEMQRADSQLVVFKSDMAGVITIEWKKIQELRTAQNFVVVRKGTKLVWRGRYANLPRGELSANANTMTVGLSPVAPKANIAVADMEDVIPATQFDKAVSYRPRLFEDWKGSASLGISLVQATQTSQTYTSAVNLSRLLPAENWLQPSSRTTLTFNAAYGNLTQPGEPTVKTSILHGDAERDEYFKPNVFVLADVGFDHDYSQGLDLQQAYGGGIGWTAIKTSKETFDLKAELDYINQQFETPSQNQKLLGSIFSEGFDRTFIHNIRFHEQLGLNPAWTNLRAYSASGNIALTVPVFKRIGVTVSSTDTFLNDPSPGFRKNSFQFSTSLTYTMP